MAGVEEDYNIYECCELYPGEHLNGHIKRSRNYESSTGKNGNEDGGNMNSGNMGSKSGESGNEESENLESENVEAFLGTKAQFCAAFYHVHEWYDNRTKHLIWHHCLDEENCIIAGRAKLKNRKRNIEGILNASWYCKPKDVVAVVKFEDSQGTTVYLARYTNCHRNKKHAEDFFKDDMKNGHLAEVVKANNDGKITLLLTNQPCNESISFIGTCNTRADQSCCETLAEIFREVLHKKNIRLCVKVTHMHRLSFKPEEEDDDETLRQRAVAGVTALMLIGVKVESMTRNDWEYLFRLTEAKFTEDKRRSDLDKTVEDTLVQIKQFTESLSSSISLLSLVLHELHTQQQQQPQETTTTSAATTTLSPPPATRVTTAATSTTAAATTTTTTTTPPPPATKNTNNNDSQ